jgi:hypothetical protein
VLKRVEKKEEIVTRTEKIELCNRKRKYDSENERD